MKLHSATLDPDAGQETIGVLQAAEEYVPLLCGLNELAPGFPRWILAAVFGGTCHCDGLDLQQRQLINLASLTALGGVEPQLAAQIKSSRRVGLDERQIIEVFVHLAPYVGLPKALAGLRAAAEVLADPAAPHQKDGA